MPSMRPAVPYKQAKLGVRQEDSWADKRFVKINDSLEANVPGIWSIGDTNSQQQFNPPVLAFFVMVGTTVEESGDEHGHRNDTSKDAALCRVFGLWIQRRAQI